MVNLIDRLPLTRALRTAWRTLRLPAAAFQDIRIIVEHGGALHHYYLTARVQRLAQRGAQGAPGDGRVRLPVADWSEVEPILAALRIAGCTILEMEVGPADLEQVFLRIMREPSAAPAGSAA